MIGVYKITSPSGKIYIGQSIDIEKRFNQYKTLSNCKNQIRLYNSFIKYGENNHVFDIIIECEATKLNALERYYQELFKCIGVNGLNCKIQNSDGLSGYMSEETKNRLKGKRNLSNETREKMRNKLIEQQQKDPDWFKKCTKGIVGRKKSKEERFKISLANTGKKHSDKTKLKMSFSKLQMSDETKAKIGLVTKGKKQSKEHIEKRRNALIGLKSKIVVNTLTGEEYKSLKYFCDLFNYNYSFLSSKLSGRKTNNTIFVYK